MIGAPRTRYTRGEVQLAYQVIGDGPIDIIWTPGFVSHLDLWWEMPERVHISRRLAGFSRMVMFDKRGTGLSERSATPAAIEDRMDDIRAVMDAVEIEHAALVGYSEGGPMSVLFAATHPDRVDALVLGSTFGQPIDTPDLEERLALLERHWGSGHPLRFFVPALDQELAARYERSSATPRAAAEILRINVTIDVRAALPAVTAPTLVTHRRGDLVVPVEFGRALAAGINGARYVELEGDTHVPGTIAEWDEELDLIEEFLTGTRGVREPDRVLATLLFTDIVDSTARASAHGDSTWRNLLETHHRDAVRLIGRFSGKPVKSTGDGVLATFDGPTRAVRCATAIVECAARTGIEVRAGLHTGEVELLEDGDIAGIAVHIASRVESSAHPGTVFVSQTVRDLTTGSDIELADEGAHTLKGVPGEWRLHRVVTA